MEKANNPVCAHRLHYHSMTTDESVELPPTRWTDMRLAQDSLAHTPPYFQLTVKLWPWLTQSNLCDAPVGP